MIKDLVVTLAQIPAKIIVMDVVVIDGSSMYGMILSIIWDYNLGGWLQMDMKYVIVPMFVGETRRIY